jgi:hypothetical protein
MKHSPTKKLKGFQDYRPHLFGPGDGGYDGNELSCSYIQASRWTEFGTHQVTLTHIRTSMYVV